MIRSASLSWAGQTLRTADDVLRLCPGWEQGLNAVRVSVLSAIGTLKKVAKDSRGRIAAAILMPGGTVQAFDVADAAGVREGDAGSSVATFSWRPARA